MVNCATNHTVVLNRTGHNTTCIQLQEQTVQVNVPPMTEEAKIVFICLFATIFFLGVTGNAIVCWVVGKKKQLSGCDVLMISLACADLLASAFAFVQPMSSFIWHQRWHLGSALCKILPTIAPISLVASSWSLVLIAADRYRIIATPMKRRLSTSSKTCAVILIWTIAIIIPAPYTLTKKYAQIRGEDFCVQDRNAMAQTAMVIYAIVQPVIVWIIPIFITAVLYGICIRKLRESSFGNENSRSTQKRIIENKKVIRMFILIGALFCICTLPYAIVRAAVTLHIAYKIDSFDIDASLTLKLCLFALSVMNSCMNPLIYAKRQPEMRAFLKKLCCKAVHPNIETAGIEDYSVYAQSGMKIKMSENRERTRGSFQAIMPSQH